VPRSLPPDPALAAALRGLREDRGLALEAVAFRAGVSADAIGRIELGRSSPSWVTVRAITKALGVSLAELAAAIEAEQ
jgi:transcriptional regulator with XRE-family HTH domain